MTFNDYVVDWFRTRVENATNEEVNDLYDAMDCFTEEHLDEDCKRYALMELSNGQEIYKQTLGYGAIWHDEQCTMLADMFDQAISHIRERYDFVDEMIDNMADECNGYDRPLDFFKDIQTGGCAGYCVHGFTYNADCKDFYIEHIDDMELYVEELEAEMGSPIANRDKLPHYVFVCWLVYEDIAYNIARELYFDEF